MTANDPGSSTPSRRRVLRYLGAGTLVAGFAGCSGRTGEEATTTAGTTTGGETTTTSGPASGSTAGVDPCVFESTLDGDSCEEAQELSAAVSEDTTIGSDCSEYVVTSVIDVSGGATLTVESGTRLTFRENTGINVQQDSALRAEGTCEGPIVFTGEEDIRGYWRGIGFERSNSTDNVLRYCVVENAGSETFTNAVDSVAAVSLWGGSRATVDSSVLRNSAGYGLYIRSTEDTLVSFEENTVTGNESGPVLTPVTEAGALAASSTYTGNERDVVRISDSTLAGGSAITLEQLDVQYEVSPSASVTVNGELTVAPGVTVSFGTDALLEVESGESATGRLLAEGTAEESITFTGTEETRGHWDGIAFNDTDSDNRLSHCVVEYGGATLFSQTLDNTANVVALRGSTVTISDSTLRDSDGYGLIVRNSQDELGAFENNTVTSNTSGAVLTPVTHADSLALSSTYTGNDADVVQLTDSTVGGDESVTLADVGVRYLVTSGQAVRVHGDLEISSGTTVSFGNNAELAVEGDSEGTGRMVAQGTAEEPITFTGEEETPGFWDGIAFEETDRDNVLQHCVVEYGGGRLFSQILDHTGNVVVYRDSTLTLTDSTLRHSSGLGLVVNNSNVSTSGNTFTNNADGDLV
jgi:hypothetical protein